MHFDSTVTLGNLLTVAAFGLAAAAYGLKRDSDIKTSKEDIVIIKEWIKGHAICNKSQMDVLEEVRRTLAYLSGKSDGKTLKQVNLKDRY